MSLFTKIKDWFSPSKRKKKKRKKEEEINWNELDYGKPAKPDNLTPIDIDPWKT
ncbi:MAG: hypothetical protein R3D71_01900 [Rickettsiales bacterium]